MGDSKAFPFNHLCCGDELSGSQLVINQVVITYFVGKYPLFKGHCDKGSSSTIIKFIDVIFILCNYYKC